MLLTLLIYSWDRPTCRVLEESTMNHKGLVVAALFLLVAVGAFAAPIVTVDKNVSICNKTKCDSASTVRDGLRHMPGPMTKGIRSIHVMDRSPVKGALFQASPDGRVKIFARGMNTTTYRNTVIAAVTIYYDMQAEYDRQWETAQAQRKYPLPSWAPRPGQCDMGVRMFNSMGQIVCVGSRSRGNHT